MSDVQLPSQGLQLVHGDKRISHDWYRYLRELHQFSGLSGSQFPLWDSRMMVPALSMTPPASNAPTLAAYSGSTGIQQYLFSAGTEQSLMFSVVVPHGYPAKTALKPLVRWAGSTSVTGVARWGIEYMWAGDGEDTPTPQTVYMTGGVSVASVHQSIQGDDIEGSADLGKGSMLICRVFRDATHADDTYPANAFLLAAGFHAQNRALGTTEVK